MKNLVNKYYSLSTVEEVEEEALEGSITENNYSLVYAGVEKKDFLRLICKVFRTKNFETIDDFKNDMAATSYQTCYNSASFGESKLDDGAVYIYVTLSGRELIWLAEEKTLFAMNMGGSENLIEMLEQKIGKPSDHHLVLTEDNIHTIFQNVVWVERPRDTGEYDEDNERGWRRERR